VKVHWRLYCPPSDHPVHLAARAEKGPDAEGLSGILVELLWIDTDGLHVGDPAGRGNPAI